MIRPADIGDASAVVALVAEMGGHDDARPDVVAKNFASAVGNSEMRALIAEEDGEVVGYAEVHARPSVLHGCREAWLAALAVAPARRRQGVGRQLLGAVERQAALMGCEVIVLESSEWRGAAHAFYRSLGFDEQAPARRLRHPVPGPTPALEDRFLILAARAASAVRAAVTGLEERPSIAMGADGAPTEAADRAAELAAAECLSELGVPVVSEEGGLLGSCPVAPGAPWICIDPLDGSRNFRAGLAPYATSFGLVVDGRSVAGYVCDLSSDRRWWAAHGGGAWVDGHPARPRAQSIALRPSPEPGGVVLAVAGYDRTRISGSTTVDLCRVADGSAGAFVDLDRGVVHVHDLAGPLAVLREAGAGVASPDGDIELVPDPTRSYRLVAAWDQEEARRLCSPPAMQLRSTRR